MAGLTRCDLCSDPGHRYTYHYPLPLCCHARRLFEMPKHLRRRSVSEMRDEMTPEDWRDLVDEVQRRIDEAMD